MLADTIDAGRLRQEELTDGLEVIELPWAEPNRRDDFVAKQVGGSNVASDAPAGRERPLPGSLTVARERLDPAELERYRLLWRESAAAMTEALTSGTP